MKNLKLKQAALTLLAGPFYLLGWLFKQLWRPIAFFIAAAQQGFTEG